MPWWLWLVAGVLLVYVGAVLALVAADRRTHARALAGFVPDCAVLFQRLLRDPRVPRSRKLPLVLVLGYLLMPIDLVPDFIPIAGQLDDAILVALVLRGLVRAAGPQLIDEHWPGPVPISRHLI
jgi:uncharacterized membrane protein YkvA (DUF1232 family)